MSVNGVTTCFLSSLFILSPPLCLFSTLQGTGRYKNSGPGPRLQTGISADCHCRRSSLQLIGDVNGNRSPGIHSHTLTLLFSLQAFENHSNVSQCVFIIIFICIITGCNCTSPDTHVCVCLFD